MAFNNASNVDAHGSSFLDVSGVQINQVFHTSFNLGITDAHANVVAGPDDGAPEARSLPLCHELLHGRAEIVDEVVSAITNCEHIALFGAGGIGKTTIAIAALHHEAVILKFGERRHFVPCDELGDDTSVDSLLELIAKYIGLKLRGVNRQSFLLGFLSTLPILLALDNAETILDHPQSYDVILPFLTRLASAVNVSLIVTSRSTALPAEVPWIQIDVQVLSPDAAKQMLLSFHNDRIEDCDELGELLELLGFHPLSIKLISQVGAQGRLSVPKLLDRWKKYRTKLLDLRGGGRLSSVRVSLDMSFNSPSLLHPSVARDVLSILAFLPQGVDELKCQNLFPSIEEIDLIMDSLSQLSLIEKRRDRITLLPPIRSYIQESIPTPQKLKDDVGAYYFHALSRNCRSAEATHHVAKIFIYEEDANCETVIIDFIDNRQTSVYPAVLDFFYLLAHHKRKKTRLADIILDLPETEDPDYIGCLGLLGWLESHMGNYRKAETILNRAYHLSVYIDDGRLESRIAEALGFLNLFLSNYDDAEMFLLRYRSFYNDGSYDVARCNFALAYVYLERGSLVKARSAANDSLAVFKTLNMLDHFAWTLFILGEIELASQNLPSAKSLFTEAKDEATKMGEDYLGQKCERGLARIHIDAGDYARAQILLEGAQKVFILLNGSHDAALCDAFLGLVQERLLCYETAKALYQKARVEIVRIGSKYDAADCAHYLGGIEKKLCNFDAAVQWFLLAGEEFIQIKVPHRARNSVDFIRSLAEEMAIRGDHEVARRAFTIAEELYYKIDNSEGG